LGKVGQTGACTWNDSFQPGVASASGDVGQCAQDDFGSNVDLHVIQTAMEGVNVQSANLSESDYSPQVEQQCERLRLLEDAATAIDDALAQAHGRVAEALLTERELNLRERQSQESSISSLLDQSAYDRISINVSLAQ
jgi:hypothetical protein